MNKKVILIHGYNKNAKDMMILKNNLEKMGYEGILVDLPLTFQKIEHSTVILEAIIAEMTRNLTSDEKIHLVGHSTGGLIIRSFLGASRYKSKIHRCVLVATPNNGSELADIVGKGCKIATNVFKTLESLQSENVKELKLWGRIDHDVGAIAGNKSNLLLGKLLKEENDGRVTVKSVQMNGLKDFIVIPYGHKEIHYQLITAELIHRFLSTGSFKRSAPLIH